MDPKDASILHVFFNYASTFNISFRYDVISRGHVNQKGFNAVVARKVQNLREQTGQVLEVVPREGADEELFGEQSDSEYNTIL